jgi:hypothetical protein
MLAENHRYIVEGGDELTGAWDSVNQVLLFLDTPSEGRSPPWVLPKGATRSLHVLERALSDLQFGGNPWLFNRPPNKRSGNPRSFDLDWLSASCVACISLMREEGMDEEIALQKLVLLLGQYKIMRPSKSGFDKITTKLISGWCKKFVRQAKAQSQTPSEEISEHNRFIRLYEMTINFFHEEMSERKGQSDALDKVLRSRVEWLADDGFGNFTKPPIIPKRSVVASGCIDALQEAPGCL